MEELKKELEALVEEIEAKDEESMGISDETPEFNDGVKATLNYIIGRIETLSKK